MENETKEVLDQFGPETSFQELKDAVRKYYGADVITDGRATDMVADYVYLSQFE